METEQTTKVAGNKRKKDDPEDSSSESDDDEEETAPQSKKPKKGEVTSIASEFLSGRGNCPLLALPPPPLWIC